MKENVLDVLVYLFENLIDESAEARDRDSLQAELIEAGFAPTEITKAFDWMEELGRRRTDLVADVPDALQADARWGAPAPPLRVYASEEIDRLDAECRGFLMFLEQQGILDATRREVVLDRLMALELDDIDLIDLKWVVLMVLFNAPGQEAAYAWMESHLLESGGERVH